MSSKLIFIRNAIVSLYDNHLITTEEFDRLVDTYFYISMNNANELATYNKWIEISTLNFNIFVICLVVHGVCLVYRPAR